MKPKTHPWIVTTSFIPYLDFDVNPDEPGDPSELIIALCAREPALGAPYTFSFLEDGNANFLNFIFSYETIHLCPLPYIRIFHFKCNIRSVIRSCQ